MALMKNHTNFLNFQINKNIKKNTNKTIFLIFFMGFCVVLQSAFAKNKRWKEFHSNKSVKMYYSPKSLKGKAVKTVAVLLNFTHSQSTSDGKKIKSVRMVQNYDCTTSRFRLRSGVNYSGEMLKGNEVSRGSEVTPPWRMIPDGTPYGRLMKIICD